MQILNFKKRTRSKISVKKILFVVMPYEGEVLDRVTAKFYKNSAVKYMPLGILSIAANIPKKYEVKILDSASLGLNLNQTIEEIEKYEPDVLGLSVVTYRAWAMCEILKRTSAPIKVVGGPHATRNAQNILKQGANSVFIDDAELSFPKWLDDGCPDGVYSGGQIDLGSIPFPARHLLDLKDYMIEENEDLLFKVGNLRLPMFSSKGCPLKCTYCDVQQKKFNFKPPHIVAEEFKLLIKLGATSVHILDDAFNIERDRIEKICQHLIENKIDIDWSARGTVEIRESVISSLSSAGCKRLHVGIESLDDKVLAWFKKSQRLKHTEQFAKYCSDYKIDILAYFIIGSPMETDSYRKKLPNMIKELGIKLPYFNLLTPLAETPYYAQLLKDGVFKVDHWSEFAKSPVKDFIIPEVRSESEEEELKEVIDSYVKFFKRDDMDLFVA
jgi:anaerobic magnesium-protoporphyrin IX monomethyl ester cyclase